MFDFFKSKPQDVKALRGAILQFIKEQLQKIEGGEGASIRGLYLFINCPDEEKHLYESAVFANEENKFKEEEIQRIVDDYALELPDTWTFEIVFTDKFPAEAIKASDVDVALFVSTQKNKALHKHATAVITVLNGHAEQDTYTISSTTGKINIGREKLVQTADGFYRKNFIAFTSAENSEVNRSVSRQHAHIDWDAESGNFLLYADDGGIPPYNKMKVRDESGTVKKLQSKEIGHRLQEGDQIILGESAVLEFSWKTGDKN
jgi:pSer/pThr/pTyr-binding forkhead associated (FHA) protein